MNADNKGKDKDSEKKLDDKDDDLDIILDDYSRFELKEMR